MEKKAELRIVINGELGIRLGLANPEINIPVDTVREWGEEITCQ